MKALFRNAQLLVELTQALKEMGHPQPATGARINSKPTNGTLPEVVKKRRANPAGISASWAKGFCEQGRLGLRWASGKASLGSCHTKRHAGLDK